MGFTCKLYALNPRDALVMHRPATTPTVYVVDDDTDVLGSLRFLLESEGFDVQTFRSAEALLMVIGASEVDCLVIDYKMPAMNGIDLASDLRNRDIDIPIVLITGYPDGNITKRAAAVGIDHVLLKPHLEESLVSRVRDAIRESEPTSR